MISVIAFFLSFCGISYQFLLARTIGQFTSDEVLSQSLSLGFYLGSMGCGAALVSRLDIRKNLIMPLVMIETLLAVLGGGVVFLLYFSHTLIEARFADFFSGMSQQRMILWQVLLFQLPNCCIGLLCGMELPLLLQLQKKRRKSYQELLAFNYFGALVASFILYLWILPRFGLLGSGLLISVINFLVAFAVLALAPSFWKKVTVAITLICAFFGCAFFMQSRATLVEQGFVKEHYLETRISDLSYASIRNLFYVFDTYRNVERYFTPYQIVDIIPDDFKIAGDEPQDFTLYLNMQTQFSRSMERPYHETMADGAINLSGSIPKKVLILGSGDGILASELLQYKEIEKISLVEIDPFMVQLARQHATLRELNHSSFFDSRVEIIIGDAFQFIRKTNEKYDAVFVDFPFPTSYELGKLFSKEFYFSLHRVLAAGGFFVADVPYWPSFVSQRLPRPYPQDIVINTVTAAQFTNIYPFGVFESFIFVRDDKRKIQFHYDKIPSWVSNKSLVNWRGIAKEQLNFLANENFVNSVFRPMRFRW